MTRWEQGESGGPAELTSGLRSASTLRDDAEPFAAVVDGAGYLGLTDAVGERFADQVEHLGAGCVGAGLLSFEGDRSALEFGEVVHDVRLYPLANSVDKGALLANTIGMTSTENLNAQREATVTKIAASEALKPAGQRLINRIPGFETVDTDDYLADALTRAALDDTDPYPMAARCGTRGHHRFEAVLRSNCADCGTANPSWYA